MRPVRSVHGPVWSRLGLGLGLGLALTLTLTLTLTLSPVSYTHLTLPTILRV